MKFVLDDDNEINYHQSNQYAEKDMMNDRNVFDRLQEHFGSHKAAAKALAVSYTRYNEWRWNPSQIPEPMRRYLEMSADVLDQAQRAERWKKLSRSTIVDTVAVNG